ncbi:MAG TPA: type II toxin-antitoxin system HicA family toxin [Candidatus Deferrimicrobium sp.]|nr:type II toxin-antitoxin system HicA family toxin [Candidatus Deferrimicrobium sp.]
MNELPLLPKRRSLEKLLLQLEFKKIGQLKNHALYKHEDGRLTTLPGYRGKKLAFTLLRLILKEINIDATQYNELIKTWE